MIKLLKCEWLRIYKKLLVAMLIHGVMLGLLVNFGLFSSDSIGFKIVLVLFYGGCGFLFGMMQMKKYTNTNHWTFFINRPISAKNIYFGLVLATIMAILIVVLLPFLTVTIIQDWLNVGVVDLRHYILLVYLFGMTLSFYLLACVISLCNRKIAYLLIMMALLPVISINVGGSVYVLLTGVVVCLTIMVASLIKPNLNGVPSGFINQLIFATAFQYSLYYIVTTSFFIISEVSLDIQYRSQNNSSKIDENQSIKSTNFRDVIFLDPQDRLISALITENGEFQELIEEIKLNQSKRIRKRIWFHPTYQQLPFMDENKTIINDNANQVVWQFSHDLMLFIGKDAKTQKIMGYLGPNHSFSSAGEIIESEVFEYVPWVSKDQIVLKNKVFQYQSVTQSFQLLFNTDDNEVLLNGLQDQGSIKSIITNKHLYVFNSIDYNNALFPLKEKIKFELPDDYNNIWDIQIAEVVDRFIVSIQIGKSKRHDIYKARQQVYEFSFDDEFKLINQINLKHNPTYLIQDLDYYISPVWKLLLNYVSLHPGRDRYLEDRPKKMLMPMKSIIVLSVLAMIYFLVTLKLSQNRSLKKNQKWLWAAMNSVIGLPGLFSFIILNPKNIQIDQSYLAQKKGMELEHV